MIPAISDYKILKYGNYYYVLTRYDLDAMPDLKIIGRPHVDRKDAVRFKRAVFEIDYEAYKRLKEMGLSFPYNGQNPKTTNKEQ